MELGRAAFSFLVATKLASWSRMSFDTAPSAESEVLYTTLYPYYIEICALSELKKRPGYGPHLRSGVGGHAVIYLNGVCRGGAAQLRLCETGTAASQGVGLSVNEHYKNANWVATE